MSTFVELIHSHRRSLLVALHAVLVGLAHWLLCIALIGGIRMGGRVFRESSGRYKARGKLVLSAQAVLEIAG